jgi:hypothetical protein
MNIGDKLYRAVTVSGIWEYVVLGIHTYEGCQQYVVESQTCSHGWKCKLLIADNGKGALCFVSLLNDDPDESQHFWHTDKTTFWPCKYDAHKELYQSIVWKSQDDIRKAKEALDRMEKRHTEIAAALALATKQAEEAKGAPLINNIERNNDVRASK